ncbi:hypothetical protein LSH36_249g00040 [Paralvinella palmiformis]|uniref:Reverse transcriptase domain-containing protein n=1 Tax=Paralvinella palmiformis TaxID=53620 RepID=A0AAD9JM99_9ANNE|nr:hypothetical protein LSH36_249g00040 [Paralvinella palmiformis]
MDTERMDPEVEPLQFDVDQVDLPPDIKLVVEDIKKVAEKLLYRWKQFPIVLPHSVTEFDQTELTSEQRDGVISFNDLFVAPVFDELEEVARDENGRSKILNDDQMHSIRRRGEFEVKSKNFPGQVHRWRLTLLLQKGIERAHNTLLNDLALSLRLLIITARNRFYSHFFSLSQSLEGIKTGLWQILDILIGMPSTTPGALYEKLHEEHNRFLVAELNVKASSKHQWSNFCDYIKDSIKAEQETNHDIHTRSVSSPAIPYSFMTPKGGEVDLRNIITFAPDCSSNHNLMQKCTIVLKKILEKESKGWYVKYKDRLITELKDQNLSYEEITRHVNEAIKEEYLRRVFLSVQNSSELEDIQPSIGKLLVDQAVSALIMEKSLEKVREKLYKHQQEHKKMLVDNYPVRSRIKAWENERLQEFECGNDSKAVSHVIKEILQQKKEVKLSIHSSVKDLADRFTHFFEGDVPENMKVARISPLLKKPSLDSEHLQNYRPVSNLSFLSKLLEKVVTFKLQSYMDTPGLHDPPECSVLGPILFLIYMLLLAHRIRSHCLHMHCYTDDTQLYSPFQNPKNADAVHNGCIKVEQCLADINAWMTNNKLKLNNDKTEIMLFVTRSSLAEIRCDQSEFYSDYGGRECGEQSRKWLKGNWSGATPVAISVDDVSILVREGFEEEFIEQNQWAAHESSLAECSRNNLEQAIYFLHRDLIFLRDREPVLRKELSKVKMPNRIFTFSTRIWSPQNWVIMQHTYEGTEIIPTVMKDTPIVDSKRHIADQALYYSAQKYKLKKTSTQYPFWRWVNYCYRTLSWTWNAMFGLGVVVPWHSSISLRALFYPKPFIARLTVNQADGSLCPDSRSLTPTLLSRLHDLWANVRLSRERFEAEPDTGFLGKSCTRHLNRFWNYVLKGGIGSMALVLLMVPLCFGGSLISAIAALTAPLWMPVVTICSQLISVLFYDFDHPRGNAIMYLFEAILYRLLVLGLLQPTCALITAVVFLPTASFFVLVAGLLKRGARAVWDAFMFHAVIKKRGRVPSCDGFVARRIEGPGLASNYFFQIQPAQALAAVEARIELHELTAWNHNTVQTIQKPLEEYKRFVQQCFGPFSAALNYKGVYQKLDDQINGILKDLQMATDRRKGYLQTGLNEDIRRRIKLSSRELKVTIAQTAKMLEDFYPEHVIDRLPQSADEFWETRHLENNDWQGLATQLLTEIFSSSFLTPLEDTDNCFKLQVEHMSLTRYIEMLKSAEFRDDLDIVNTVHTPKGDIDVDAPYVELYVFSPRKERVNYESTFMSRRRKISRLKPWKKHTVLFKEIEKLQIPLPIPHPTVICVLIHNRENDQEPIDMDDPMCQEIFRAAEHLIYVEPPPLSGTDTFDTETSTPDRGTNSEPDVQLSHLAEQESSAFSDDNIRSMSADSMLEPAILETSQADVVTGEPEEAHLEETGVQNDSDSEQVGSRVMYHEDEANTSCILQMESEDGEEEEEEVGDDGGAGDVRVKLVKEPTESSDDSDDEGDHYSENYEDTHDITEGISEAFSRMLSSKTSSRSGTF